MDEELKILEELEQVKQEHRALDEEIQDMMKQRVIDQIKLARLKKQKLFLKDRISKLEALLHPDLIA